MLTVTAKKSTLQRIRNEFSHVISAESESAKDFGLTLGTSWRYGKFTLTDNETGEIMDYGTPATVKYNGETYGCIVWGERESSVDCNGVNFSTCDETLDYCFPIPSAKAIARYNVPSADVNESESETSDNRNESESENETIEIVSQEGSLTDEFTPIVNESKESIMCEYVKQYRFTVDNPKLRITGRYVVSWESIVRFMIETEGFGMEAIMSLKCSGTLTHLETTYTIAEV